MSYGPGLVDFSIGLVNSVDNLPDGQLKFLGKFKLQNFNQSYWSIILVGLVEMTFGLVGASYDLPEWQAVKLTFFAPYISYGPRRGLIKKQIRTRLIPSQLDQLRLVNKEFKSCGQK